MIFALRPGIAGDLQCCCLKTQIINLFCLLPHPAFGNSEAALNLFFLPNNKGKHSISPTALREASFHINAGGQFWFKFRSQKIDNTLQCRNSMQACPFLPQLLYWQGEGGRGKTSPLTVLTPAASHKLCKPCVSNSQQSVKTRGPESQPSANA